MFTGIIEKLGTIEAAERKGGPNALDLRLSVRTGFKDLALGESVAVSGVCLTVVAADADSTVAAFDVSVETLRRSNLGEFKAGSVVNLERALLPTTRLSGHWVQGHVDGLATLASITPEGETYRLEVELPADGKKYVVEKGSISLDGISLTVNGLIEDAQGLPRIQLQIIPHTWRETSLHRRKAGDRLNVEWDILAKYVERLCSRT
ncbi:MAG TPA: riboflavin synthase [Bdellovibrionota bacterium]|jgi:riboflavin synthase|nr:riboflavin synthase [Bdellovibrionota bacterium]